MLSHNIFEQITRTQDIVARCLSDQLVQMTVKSVLVFVGSDVELDVIDPPVRIEIMNFAEACAWLTRLHLSTNVSHNICWKAALSRYFVPAYRLEHDLSVMSNKVFVVLSAGHLKWSKVGESKSHKLECDAKSGEVSSASRNAMQTMAK